MGNLQDLCDETGMTDMELAEEGTFDSVCQGICVNECCSYTCSVEPDCDSGYCEECGTNTVQSALILMGMI